MGYAKEYSISELMAAVTARQIRNDDVAFIGVGIPLIAGTVAVNTHAPEAILVYEGGGVGARSRRMPWTISDTPTTENALLAGAMHRVFGDCQAGFVTLGIIGGAEIDPFGNLNTTVILGQDGTYDNPKVRLPGSGGANDIASSAQRTVIMMRMQKGKFREKIDFITSPGHLSGAGAREKAGLRGKGPVAVVTDRCLFKFNDETKEMYLDTLYPGITVEQVKSYIDWDLKVAADVKVAEPPTEEQIQVMKAFDPAGTVLGSKSMKGTVDLFDNYYNTMKQAYRSVKISL